MDWMLEVVYRLCRRCWRKKSGIYVPGLPRVVIKCLKMSQIRVKTSAGSKKPVVACDWCNKSMNNINSNLVLHAALVFPSSTLLSIVIDELLRNVLVRVQQIVEERVSIPLPEVLPLAAISNVSQGITYGIFLPLISHIFLCWSAMVCCFFFQVCDGSVQ